MKMGRSLSVEAARRCPTILCGSEALKAFLDDGRILTMVIGMHLDIRCADVDFITAGLKKQTNITSWLNAVRKNLAISRRYGSVNLFISLVFCAVCNISHLHDFHMAAASIMVGWNPAELDHLPVAGRPSKAHLEGNGSVTNRDSYQAWCLCLRIIFDHTVKRIRFWQSKKSTMRSWIDVTFLQQVSAFQKHTYKVNKWNRIYMKLLKILDRRTDGHWNRHTTPYLSTTHNMDK